MPYLKRRVNDPEVLEPRALLSADGWWAIITGENPKPLIAWALLAGGELVGLIEHAGIMVSAEDVQNFRNFQHASPQ